MCASLDDFLIQPRDIVDASGAAVVAILDANQPVFYVVSPDTWHAMSKSKKLISKNDNFENL